MLDKEIMDDVERWLNTPELQHRPNASMISFLADIHRQWRTKQKITAKQKAYCIALLNKHWKK